MGQNVFVYGSTHGDAPCFTKCLTLENYISSFHYSVVFIYNEYYFKDILSPPNNAKQVTLQYMLNKTYILLPSTQNAVGIIYGVFFP